MRHAITAAIMSLTACTPMTQVAATSTTSQSLVGNWRVAQINGQDVNPAIEMNLLGTDDELVFNAPCGPYIWAHFKRKSAYVFQTKHSLDPHCLATARIVQDVFLVIHIIGDVDTVTPNQGSGLRLTGDRGSILLRSQ